MKLNDIHGIFARDPRDPEYAALYLDDALRDGSPEEFLLALKNILRVTRETDLGEENLDRELSESRNPDFSIVYRIISALGFQISIAPPVSTSRVFANLLRGEIGRPPVSLARSGLCQKKNRPIG
ncbi:DNA-binding protein [Pannus brasiliensis]|uniref:helix-turn-helix domain-containing transcriptional regulator n=1 Tax=Pannus brasiliensis TaxID=1579216 RepID=UPI003BEF26CB